MNPLEETLQQHQVMQLTRAQSGLLSGLLGGAFGQGFAQQQQPMPPHPLSLQSIKSSIWPEHKRHPAVVLSFFDKLRNEIDEWLKL